MCLWYDLHNLHILSPSIPPAIHQHRSSPTSQCGHNLPAALMHNCLQPGRRILQTTKLIGPTLRNDVQVVLHLVLGNLPFNLVQTWTDHCSLRHPDSNSSWPSGQPGVAASPLSAVEISLSASWTLPNSPKVTVPASAAWLSSQDTGTHHSPPLHKHLRQKNRCRQSGHD